jgi:hypothetical protein
MKISFENTHTVIENFEFATFDDFEKWVRVRFYVTNSEKLLFKNQDGTGYCIITIK